MIYEQRNRKKTNVCDYRTPGRGKTSLTEKLLLFGGQIQVAGAVKSNKIKENCNIRLDGY